MTEATTASPGTETAAPVVDSVAATTTETTAAAAPVADAAAAAPATPAEPTTLLAGTETTETVKQVAPADWPTDWRQKLAGEDKKTLERLGRFGSPADLLKSYNALELRLSSGEYKKVGEKPGPDAKPEELAAWRKENGIPESPEAYKIELPNGVVFGEADKPMLDSFTKAAHERGWDNGKVNEALGWYAAEQQRLAADRAEKDLAFQQSSDDALRAEWGPADYRPNINAVKNLLAAMPEGAALNFMHGRLADGTKIGDNAGMVKWLASMSRELNPANTLVPAGTGDVGKSVSDRISEIQKYMQTNRAEYFRDEKMQSEYLRLLEAQEKMKVRAA